MKNIAETRKNKKLLIRACHACLKINESESELERCTHCSKSFLPLRYFEKIHAHKNFDESYEEADEIEEKDLIKGLFVLW